MPQWLSPTRLSKYSECMSRPLVLFLFFPFSILPSLLFLHTRACWTAYLSSVHINSVCARLTSLFAPPFFISTLGFSDDLYATMPPRSSLTSSFSVTDANNEVVCPLKNNDGSNCRKRCLGVSICPEPHLSPGLRKLYDPCNSGIQLELIRLVL